MRVLVAGASGALGRPLIRLLREASHEVWGLAHRPGSLKTIEGLGAHPLRGDALNRDNIFEAARTFKVQRYVQQLSGFYLDGGDGLATESSPLRINAPETIGESARMYAALEHRVSSAPEMEGVGLRYGFFYGPGTWYWPDGAFSRHLSQGDVPLIGAGRSIFSFIHVDDAAQATVAALTAPAGLYKVVDSQPTKMSEWLPAYARWIGSDVPPDFDEQAAAA